ncbi:phage terminase large subunit [Alsobacter sp. SYSU M60028]|uniref:Phage terminase large subunit n=1 Tax=Alsobacter ponti TaxID=2962936 RepID=A0ABT1LD60_9HYPH|nr:phage terminase large subunit [Alsobacter ponti]MCP8939394.1 phage terminase large subunit [Alsobacter ponti]
MSAAAAVHLPTLTPTPFQARALTVPEAFDLFLGGGRGGGKSVTLALLFLRHIEQYGGRARALFVRQSFPGLVDFEQVTREVFGLVYGGRATYNASTHLWRFPSGATLQLDQFEGLADFSKFQGKSFSMIAIDEAGQYADPGPIDLLRSCLRAPAPMQPRFVLAANPGGPGHHWLLKRHILTAAPWEPYLETASGRTFVTAPSTFVDNPNLDREGYARQLAAATSTDPELGKAWLHGDWSVQRGAFFSAVLDHARNMVERWEPETVVRASPRGDGWKLYLAHDFGVSAPAVTLVMGKSPGIQGPDGRWYPKDSLVVLDESATNAPGQLNAGMGYTVPRLAEDIKELAKRWAMRPEGVADDAIFARTGHGTGSIADEFRAQGVYFTPAKKADRRTGWEIMRRLFLDAGKPDQPGLYVARPCEYLWTTLPILPRDPKKPDDVDSRAADHGADAARYGCLRQERTFVTRELRL